MGEVGSAQVGSAQEHAITVEVAQVGAGEARARHHRGGDVRLAQACAREVAPRQHAAGEVGLEEVAARAARAGAGAHHLDGVLGARRRRDGQEQDGEGGVADHDARMCALR